MRKRTLHPHEHRFDPVPDADLVPCCWWEYMRESKTLISAIAHSNLNGIAAVSPGLTAWWPVLYRFRNRPIKPWQSLPKDARSQLSPPDASLPVCGRGFKEAALFEFAMLAEVTRATWDRPTEDLITDLDGPAIRVRRNERHPLLKPSEWHLETRCFTVNWSESNESIARACFEWLKANRPQDCPNPDPKGRKLISWRVALEDLGVMREIYADPSSADSERNRLARRAFKTYHRLLSAPLDDRPIHWPSGMK